MWGREWLETVRKTGRWDQPRFWRYPNYRKFSPWSPDELTAAFQALRRIYPPKEVKRIFSSSDGLPWLAPLLMDPWRPDLSGLLSLGFDAAHAQIERYPGLVGQLRNANYAGARLEVTVLAALARARIAYEYEPFAKESTRRGTKGESFPNPDLKLRLGLWAIADIKKLQTSERAKRRQQRLMLIQWGRKENWEPLPVGITLTGEYDRLEKAGTYSEDQLDERALSLRVLAFEKASELRASNETKATIGDGLATIDLGHRELRGGSVDDPRDEQRIVAKLDEGASQIPPNERGIIIVEPSMSEGVASSRAISSSWLRQAKREVIGVVLLEEHWLPDAPRALCIPQAVWRSGAPLKMRQGSHWNRLMVGLNWHWAHTRMSWASPRNE